MDFDPTKPLFKQKAVGEAEFTLPCGLLVDGVLHREAVLTPMTVRDRKDAVDPSRKNNEAKIATRLLENRLVRIGGLQPVPTVSLRKLLSADREFLLLKLYEVSNPGKPIQAIFQCANCKENLDVEIPVDSVNVISMTDEQQAAADGDVRYWELKVPEWEVVVRFRYPDGELQETVAPKMRANVAEGELLMLTKMMVSWNGGPPLTVAQMEGLPLGLMTAIESDIMAHALGPQFRHKLYCENCGTETEGGLDISSFLFKG